jgi:hypothetical protein
MGILDSPQGVEECVRRNATTRGLTPARSHKAGWAVTANQKPEEGEPRPGSTETWRKYRVQVIVSDPEQQQVLNLTKLVFEEDMHSIGYATLDIQEMLQLLVQAAGEWSV